MSETQSSEPTQDNPGQGNDTIADGAEGDTAPTEQTPQEGTPATGTTDVASGPGSAEEPFDGQDEPVYVSDDQLPEDLRPTDDNPLAKPKSEDDEDAGMSLTGDGPPA